MLSIDVRDCDIVVAMPHRHGGVARMLVALEDAGLGVSRIEPRAGQTGMYRLTANGSPELAVRILEGIGCRVGSLMGRESPSSAA
jgi:DNA-binding PadR family transcriptional regulator